MCVCVYKNFKWGRKDEIASSFKRQRIPFFPSLFLLTYLYSRLILEGNLTCIVIDHVPGLFHFAIR